MKKSELTTGEFYLVNGSPDWGNSRGRWGAKQVQVLSTETYNEPASWSYGRSRRGATPEAITLGDETIELSCYIRKGHIVGESNGVLVRDVRANHKTGETTFSEPRVQQLGHIRQLWSEYDRERKLSEAAAKAASLERQRQQAAQLARLNEAKAQLACPDVTNTIGMEFTYMWNTPIVQMDLDTFCALVGLLTKCAS